MKSSEERVIVVSGASSGIGQAAAVAFQRTGAIVHGFASNAGSLAAARDRHPEIRWRAVDLTKRTEIDAAIKAIVDESGRIDTLVNNAGIYKFAPLEASDDTLMRSQFEINVFGLIALTQAALPALKASQGSIVNVSSTSGHKAMRDQSMYGATKAAVNSLTRTWALELGAHRVRVNAIAPGPTETEGIARLPFPKEVFAAMRAQIEAQLPLGRTASSAEVAHWIVVLADPQATWLTGQVLGVDGGLSVT